MKTYELWNSATNFLLAKFSSPASAIKYMDSIYEEKGLYALEDLVLVQKDMLSSLPRETVTGSTLIKLIAIYERKYSAYPAFVR